MTPPADVHDASPPASSTWTRRALRLSVAVIGVAAALRIRGGWNDLWLDEIWSLEIAREVRSPIDAPSVVAGVATVDAGPEWLVVSRDSFELPVSRGDQIHDEVGRRFDLVREFPAALLAGIHWFVYKNQAQ